MLITQADFVKSSSTYRELPVPDLPEFAFIGRSNVGKSSLINMLTGRRGLAKTSSAPGKTRLINHFKINNSWYMVDLPGYGYARVSKASRHNFERMITDYLTLRPSLITTFVLVDSRHAPLANDLEFIRTLGVRQLPFALVFTKFDKKGRPDSNVSAYRMMLRKEWEELPPIFVTSAIDGTGKKELLDYIQSLNEQVSIH
ncbi:MAG: ribosome biogenesis GTP-binding protein YihA/YsxC [Bacteroidetes bacterium]|jgi:GTP-binding protein|nr:ribosome biogenesis GTP-binding protein YihA/YsxC [Bacteroidota bacterium]